MSKLRSARRPSPAFLLAFVALLVTLGGVGYAAKKLPKNSVGAKQIKTDAVGDAEVKDGSLKAGDFAPGAVPQGPTAAGAFRDPAVAITSTSIDAPTPIATLSGLQAGTYAITAKTVVETPATADKVHCLLLAPAGGGGDVDLSITTTLEGDPYTASMQVLHEFPAGGGQARVACAKEVGGHTVTAALTKIQAIRLSSATNVGVSG